MLLPPNTLPSPPTFSIQDPRSVPIYHTRHGRDVRRGQIVDAVMQGELEATHALGHTWGVPAVWKRLQEQPDHSWSWVHFSPDENLQLETGYFSANPAVSIVPQSDPLRAFHADLMAGQVESDGVLYKIDRQHISVLVAMLTATDGIRSLLNALSLALWGVHDRSQILESSLIASIQDPIVSTQGSPSLRQSGNDAHTCFLPNSCQTLAKPKGCRLHPAPLCRRVLADQPRRPHRRCGLHATCSPAPPTRYTSSTYLSQTPSPPARTVVGAGCWRHHRVSAAARLCPCEFLPPPPSPPPQTL